MNGNTDGKSTALIMGVTGMAGLSIAQALKSPTAPGGPWTVYGVARRPKPIWFPSTIVDRYVTFDAADVTDTKDKLSSISCHVTHVFWVALYLGSNEEDNIIVNSAMLSNVLHVLTAHNRILHITLQTGTGHYMGQVHDKAQVWSQLKAQEPPFREDMGRLPCPNFYYSLEDIVKSYGPKLTYSIHRASIIIGASTRSVYNLLLTLGVYAEICKYQNVPFRYPGSRYTWEHFCDMIDTRVLADQHVRAAVTEGAKNEAFNCTNGDVFSWRRMWRVLCEEFGVEFVPLDDDECGFDLVAEMRDKGHVWDKIVEEKGLLKTKMEEIVHFEFLQNVTTLNFQLVSDMNKSKEFGFLGHVDTLKSVRFWVAKLRKMNIIP